MRSTAYIIVKKNPSCARKHSQTNIWSRHAISAHCHRIWCSETTTAPLQIWCYEFDYAPVITPKSRWVFELEKIHRGSDRASTRTCIRQIFKKVVRTYIQVHASKSRKTCQNQIGACGWVQNGICIFSHQRGLDYQGTASGARVGRRRDHYRTEHRARRVT